MNIAPALPRNTEKILNNYPMEWLSNEIVMEMYHPQIKDFVFKVIPAIWLSPFEFKAVKIAIVDYYHTKPAFKRIVDENFQRGLREYGYGIHIFINANTHKSNGDYSPHFNITLKDTLGTEMEAHCFWNIKSAYPKLFKMTVSFKI